MRRKRKARSMSINPSRQPSVLWVAESNWVPNSGIKPHSHDYYHLFIVRQGPLGFTCDNEAYSLKDGEALLALPGVVHSMNNTALPMGRIYEVKFMIQSPSLREQLANLPARLPATPFVDELIRELVAESDLQTPSTPSYVSDYLLSLLDFYIRHYGKPYGQDTTIIDTTGFSKTSIEIVQFLESHYEREFSLQEVADAVGLNKNYICSVFKRDSGVTIGSCQAAIRIRKAAEMISFSDMNLTQVASATGFANLSHFNRIFKKVVGIPPGQYRRMFTGDIVNTGDSKASLQEIITQNGFIVAVLGRKKLTIHDIIKVADEEETP